MPARAALAALAACLVAALAAPSFADVVGPPPASCPAGSTPESCHGGPYCRPVPCDGAADCADGEACVEQLACLGAIGCAGLIAPGEDPNDYRVDRHLGACDGPAGSACGSGGACTAVKQCMVPSDAAGGGGGCAGSTGLAGLLGLIAGLALIGGLARSRRRGAGAP